MGSIFIKGAEVYIDNGFSRKTVEIIDSKIKIHDENYVLPDDGELVEARGKKLVPGFIDIHTHGGVGVDVNAATADELEKIGEFFAKNGTTSWLCSVLTDTEEQTLWCIDQFNEYKKRKGRVQIWWESILKDHFWLKNTREPCLNFCLENLI